MLITSWSGRAACLRSRRRVTRERSGLQMAPSPGMASIQIGIRSGRRGEGRRSSVNAFAAAVLRFDTCNPWSASHTRASTVHSVLMASWSPGGHISAFCSAAGRGSSLTKEKQHAHLPCCPSRYSLPRRDQRVPASLAWLFSHLLHLIEFDKRLLVLVQRAWNCVTWNRGARLVNRPSPFPPR